MVLMQVDVRPIYTWRPDWRYPVSSGKFVFLRNIQYVIVCKATEDISRTKTAASILGDIYIRQAASNEMRKFYPPDLTITRQTLYTEEFPREGSDYISLNSGIYDWRRVSGSNLKVEPVAGKTDTVYVLTGRWSIFQGMFSGITRTV